MRIEIGDGIKVVAPQLMVLTIEADVVNCNTSDELWQELVDASNIIKNKYQLSEINSRSGVKATRNAYKALGKEPNRYRPSCEALCRRIVKGMDLYRINALVDIINIISFMSGYSIGGFDVDKIQGDVLRLGVGEEGEEFDAIGRGLLNIACLPVYRDGVGGIGTPTSDVERTKLTLDTRRLLMCINIYGEEMSVQDTIALSENLLTKYCSATNIKITQYTIE